jgi:hypothetical protein
VCIDELCVPEEENAFSCRDRAWPSPSSAIVNFSLSVADLVGDVPRDGVIIQACPNFDPNCQSPIDEATTDAEGNFTMPLQEGFRGHLFVPSPPSDPALAPLKAHLFPPPDSDPSVPVRADLRVTTLPIVSALAALLNASVVAETGHVFFTAIDCDGAPLDDVAVSASVVTAETTTAYIGASGQPDKSLIGTGPAGQGAIINLPPGFVTIRGVHAIEGKIFEQSAVVAADTITSVPIVPSPVP